MGALSSEGGTYSKFVQEIRDIGYNNDISLEIGIVEAPLPNVTVRLSDSIILENDDLAISETVQKLSPALKSGDRLILIGNEITQQYFAIDRVV